MAVNEIHVNDIGTVFELTIYENEAVVDLSTATNLEIIFKKPDNTSVTKTGVLVGDGTQGRVRYTTVDGDLDQQGNWKVQGKVVFPTGSWSSDIKTFKVYPNLV